MKEPAPVCIGGAAKEAYESQHIDLVIIRRFLMSLKVSVMCSVYSQSALETPYQEVADLSQACA